MRMKDLFTTGEAADICRVSQQTIIRCFDTGRLEGFRVPGSKFRRIPRAALLKFMKDNRIPLDNLESGKKKILIVDDDVEIVELISEVLSRDGRFELKTASSGYEAGMATQQFRPDLILLDIRMPNMDGYEVCRRLKAGETTADIPVIFLTGESDAASEKDALDAGAAGYITKPIKPDVLLEKISDCLAITR